MPMKPSDLRRDGQPLGSYQHETYRLDSCLPLISKNISGQGRKEGSSITNIDLFGMTISGVDRRLISSASVKIQVPLAEGKSKIMAVNKDARIKIKPGTVANASLDLSRDPIKGLSLSRLKIEFSHKIKLRNPSAALIKKRTGSGCGISIKDKISSVFIRSITVDANGKVSVDGFVRALKVIKSKIRSHSRENKSPAIDENLLVRLGLIGPKKGGSTRNLEGLNESFDIRKLLRNIGAITKEGTYSLEIKGDESRISALKNNSYFRGPKAPIDINLAGKLSVDKSGDVNISINNESSKISSSLGEYRPNLNAKFTNLGNNRPVDLALEGKVYGESRSLGLDTYTHHSVRKMLPRRRHHVDKLQLPKHEDEFNSSFGSKKISASTTLNVKAKFERGLSQIDGSATAFVDAKKPYAKTQERGMHMDGDISARLNFQRLSYRRGHGLKDTRADAEVCINPSDATIEKYPSLKPLSYNYQVKIGRNGNAKVVPPEYGATRLVSPIENFEGHFERIDDYDYKADYHPIGTYDNFVETQKKSGSQIRKADEVELLIDGVKSMPARLKLISDAKESICFQTLVFKADASGWKFARALVDAAARGVKVYAIVDGLGNVESLKDLENPHPIYQFLRENGVNLRTYNGQIETGLRKMFNVVKEHPEAFRIKSPKSVKSIAHVLRFLEQIVDAAENEEGILSQEERSILRGAVHNLFMGKEGVSPQTAVNELKQVLQGNLTSLKEILLVVKRMGQASYRWHEKYLIADGEIGIFGGMNIADEYLLGGTNAQVEIRGKHQPAWRDTDVKITGDVVKEAYKSFSRNWLQVARVELPPLPSPAGENIFAEKGGVNVGMIQHRPFMDGDHKVINFILYNLRSLKRGERAWFETAYFLPRGVLRALQKELVRSAKRGVDVRILTNSEKTSDFGPLVEAAVFDTRELLEAGAKVYHRNNERMVHAKVTVLGDKLTMVGSWNFDNRSAAHDSEDVCAIYDEKITKQMTEQLIVDMTEQSDEVTLKKIGSRSLSSEIKSAGMLLAAELA